MNYLDILRRLEQDKRTGLESVGSQGQSESPALAKKEKSPPEPERPALTPGALIHWRSMDGTTQGPAVLRGTFEDQGCIWAWFALAGTDYLVRADLISKAQEPEELDR